jgi:hypothetical protein
MKTLMSSIEVVNRIKLAGYTPTIVDAGQDAFKQSEVVFRVGVKFDCIEEIWYISRALSDLQLVPTYDRAKGLWFDNVEVDAQAFNAMVRGLV